MAKQQRAIRIEQKGQMAAIQQLESRSDEELAAETKYKAHAQLVLGTRAAERMDAKAARAHFQRALVAARPQERMQFRRVADHALAIAERRADDVKLSAERLGMEAPTKKQMRGLRLLGLIAPPKSAGALPRVRGIMIVIVLIVLILLLGFGIISGGAAVAGGMSLDLRIFWTMVLVLIAGGVAVFLGRRRQKSAQAKRAEQISARSR
ncbi:MAG: hypothetical protein ACLP0J_04395 [Solirubrobacteraceae bacterium]|jgi:hypothetical protein